MDDSRIIPYYAHPHVYTRIIDNTYYTEDTAEFPEPDRLPFATCVVTGADRGIDNRFIRVSNLRNKKVLFGKGNYKKYGQASIQADLLFNGNTDVWFCRVLPDNASYANFVLLALYRTGNESTNTAGSTMKRLEIKFVTKKCTKGSLSTAFGAETSDDLIEYAHAVADAYNTPTEGNTNADIADGYKAVPVCFIRSIGRGRYGNDYSISITRDRNAEKDYDVKMYDYTLIANDGITRIINIFAGSLYQTTVSNRSTLISDVLSQFAEGTCPIDIYPFEDSFETLYNAYQDIVAENARNMSDSTDENNVTIAKAITREYFDPLFGYMMNTKTNSTIPFYKNYTVKSTPYEAPDLTVETITDLPATTAAWAEAAIDSTVLVRVDGSSTHNNEPYLYTVTAVSDDGAITYDDGKVQEIDEASYTGENISKPSGIFLSGGSDGDFEEVQIVKDNNEIERVKPSDAQFKLLLAREQASAFHGYKDRRILSPSRINLDFIFDANYNMSIATLDIPIDGKVSSLYYKNTTLTTAEAKQLSVFSSDIIGVTDINVKQAMYDLVAFRNKNGIINDTEPGAGCHLHLDCGLIGNYSTTDNISSEVSDLIEAFVDYTGRATSIDIGYYDIFDPYTGRREPVTVSYYLAENLIPHLIRYGINKPFVMKNAQLQNIQRNTRSTLPNQMIRDSFQPDIDLIDWDVKERLFSSRINYYITTDEGRVVQRACQNTRQLDASALLEENNVRVLNTLKKGLEKACNSYLFDWNEPTARKGYTDSQMAIYRPWIGTMVQDLDIRFEADEWEQERMIMHCYVVVKFRDIIKRIILQINIERPEYTTSTSEGGE